VDNRISVCSLTLAVAGFLGVAIPVLIAAELLPNRFYGLGHIALVIAVGLYVRQQICRLVAERERVAFKLGQASHDIERGSLAGVRSLVD
jgi:hypothetical protein